jgi:hypothetical protein
MRTHTIFCGLALTVAVFAAQAGCSSADDTSGSEQAGTGGDVGNDASAQAGAAGAGGAKTDGAAGTSGASAGGTDASAGGADASGGADTGAGGAKDAAIGTDTGPGGATDAASSSDGASDAGASDAGDEPACDAGAAPNPSLYDLIAGWEDGTTNILSKNGRQGYLFEVSENMDHPDSGVGVQVPPPGALVTIPGGHACSKFAFRSRGSGFTTWGAQVGLTLNAVGGLLSPYDASSYTVIRFWAKSGSGTEIFVAVSIPNKLTIPQGGVCGADAEAGDGCNNHFTQIVGIPGTWTEITVAFANLAQDPYWGYRTGQPFDASAVYEILFSFQPGNGAIPFDFWLDDIAFVK